MIASCLVAIGINFSGVPSLDATGNRIPVTLSLKLHELAAPGDSPLHAPSVLLSKGSFSETLHLCPSARNIASYKPDTCLRQAGQPAGQRGVLAGPTDATMRRWCAVKPRCKEMDRDHHAYDQHPDGKESRWDPSLKEHPGGTPLWNHEGFRHQKPKPPQEVDVFLSQGISVMENKQSL